MNTQVHTILINGRETPIVNELKLVLRMGTIPGTVRVTVYPYPQAPKGQEIIDLPVQDGVLDIPLKILFVSYAREDEKPVLELVEKLMGDGYTCWLDKKQILPGDRWEIKIEKAISNTQFALVFLSSQSVKKTGYVQREWTLIHKQASYKPSSERYLIPIKLDACEPPHEFSEYNWLDLSQPDAYNFLLSALK